MTLFNASTTSGDCSMNNDFMAFLTLLILLASVVKVNLAFQNVTVAELNKASIYLSNLLPSN